MRYEHIMLKRVMLINDPVAESGSRIESYLVSGDNDKGGARHPGGHWKTRGMLSQELATGPTLTDEVTQALYPLPLSRYSVSLHHIALCFPDIVSCSAIPPIRTPISH